MTFEEFKAAVAQGAVDTMPPAPTDMRGRLQGRRLADSKHERMPRTMRDLNAAHAELNALQAAVTDWERYRGFERL